MLMYCLLSKKSRFLKEIQDKSIPENCRQNGGKLQKIFHQDPLTLSYSVVCTLAIPSLFT